MSGAAVPVEAAGEDLTLGLWLLASTMFGIALLRTWNYTFGALLHLLASALTVKVWRIHLNLGGPFDAANRYLQEALGKWVLGNEQALGLWWHANKAVVSYLGNSITDFGVAVHGAIHNLVFGTIPNAANDAVRPVARGVGTVTRVVRVNTTRIEHQIVNVGRAQAATLEREFGLAWRGIDHIRTVAIPRLWRAVHGIDADVGRLEHAVGRVIPRRLTRLEKALGAGALTAAGIVALTKVFPWFKCSNVGRFNRQLCRAPFGSLDWLLADVFEAVLVTELCAFIQALSRAMATAEPLLLAFVDAENVLIGCDGADAPRPLPLRQWEAVPPTGGVSVSL